MFTSVYFVDARKKVIHAAFEDFRRFFSRHGFTIKQTDIVTTASYEDCRISIRSVDSYLAPIIPLGAIEINILPARKTYTLALIDLGSLPPEDHYKYKYDSEKDLAKWQASREVHTKHWLSQAGQSIDVGFVEVSRFCIGQYVSHPMSFKEWLNHRFKQRIKEGNANSPQ